MSTIASTARLETEIKASGRLVALDSLRGLAAVVVVIDHLLLTFGWTGYLDHFGLRLLVAGPGAVVLFFVLSGMVLAKTFIDKDRHYPPYIIKRVARVYLPFAGVTLLAAILSRMIGQAPLPTRRRGSTTGDGAARSIGTLSSPTYEWTAAGSS